MRRLLLFLVLTLSCPGAFAADRAALFAVPDFQTLPPATALENEVHLYTVYFDGAPFNGAPTRIFGFYARPAAPGKYPGVVQLHGAGLVTLDPNAAVFYARQGYCCLSLDWAGPGDRRVGPTSTFSSTGTSAKPVLLPDGSVDRTKKWTISRPEQSGITNGVRFVLRAFEFLRNRPEVDANKLCLSGMSAGAHLSLLVLGQDPRIKAAAVKYGCGYIRDLPGFFGGYFGPLVLASKEDQDLWLDALDPKWYLPDYQASVLLLSGTNDIFFWMPCVLETWRHIPSDKRLVMLPNDNHSQVGNEEFPLRYFRSVFGDAPAFPQATTPTVQAEGDNLRLTAKVTGPSPLSQVNFAVMCMPLKTFSPGGKDTKWTLLPATQDGDHWTATTPAPKAGEQLIAYVHAEDETGAKVSSDTVEVPDFPRWRGLPEPPAAPATPAAAPTTPATPATPTTAAPEAGNLFLDPSFEGQKKGRVGDLHLTFVGAPRWDLTGAQAHTGQVAVGITGGDKDYLGVGAPAVPGKRYRLSGWFKAEHEGVKVRLQINWGKVGGGLVKFELSTPPLTTAYQKLEIVATAPPETGSAVLIFGGGSGPDEVVWMDDVFYGEVN